MGSFLAFCGGLAVAFVLACYRGLMLSTFWSWFIMPVFKDVPAIGIATACGISLLVACLTHQTSSSKPLSFGQALGYGFIYNTIVFFIGWIITWFL